MFAQKSDGFLILIVVCLMPSAFAERDDKSFQKREADRFSRLTKQSCGCDIAVDSSQLTSEDSRGTHSVMGLGFALAHLCAKPTQKQTLCAKVNTVKFSFEPRPTQLDASGNLIVSTAGTSDSHAFEQEIMLVVQRAH